MLTYTVVLWPEPDGSAINVRVPAMPGLFTWGASYELALESAREAIMLHLEGFVERGQPLPEDRLPRKDLEDIRRNDRIEEVTVSIDLPLEPTVARSGVSRRIS